MLNGAEIFLGPAEVAVPTGGVQGSSATALTPTLLGTLAEGIVALGGLEDPEPAFRIDFNCLEDSNENQVVAVDIPMTGRTDPLHLTFNKQCNASAANTQQTSPIGQEEEIKDDSSEKEQQITAATEETLISPIDKLMQLSEGRTPDPLEDTIFTSFIDWIRLVLVTLSTLGLFYALFLSFADDRQ